ncbi:hypothetical protein GE09DRAFT_1141404 [Coniochaeta sp. 2T2.1]|nr:hypothetical protein GE09DRAFT_1141404 [Coniochaeta sp. 2T2.1]
METRKTKLGVDHPDTLTSMADLAFMWKSQGRHEDALALMQDCVKAQQRVLGLEHPDTLSSLGTISDWVARFIAFFLLSDNRLFNIPRGNLA